MSKKSERARLRCAAKENITLMIEELRDKQPQLFSLSENELAESIRRVNESLNELLVVAKAMGITVKVEGLDSGSDCFGASYVSLTKDI